MKQEKIYNNAIELLEDHEVKDWEDFRKFVQTVTDGVADVGYIGGSNETHSWDDVDLDEINGIYFLTSETVGQIMYFPIPFEQFAEEIDTMEIICE
jgi:hypothetical protein